MKTLDLNSTLTAAKLNESMFKKFGTKINFESYSREDLENYRNLLRTKLHQVEGSTNFNDLLTNETYQKDKYMVGVLTAKIKEMLGESKLAGTNKKPAKKTAKGTEMKANEGKKIDQNKDGKNDFKDVQIARMKASGAIPKDKKVKESFPTVADAKARAEKEKTTGKFDKKKNSDTGGTIYTRKSSTFDNGTEDKPKEKKVKEALKGGQTKLDVNKNGKLDKKDFEQLRAKKKVKESTLVFRRHVRIVNEGLTNLLMEDEEGKAKAITAASDMVNDFTTWMQRVGQYQTKSMIELADSIRAEFGQEEAEAFKAAVAPALAATLEVMTAERESISHAVAVLAGEASDVEQMGMPGGEAPDMTGGADEFGGEEIPGGEMDSMNAGGDEFAASDAASTSREMRAESRKLAVQRKLQESHSLMRSLSK